MFETREKGKTVRLVKAKLLLSPAFLDDITKKGWNKGKELLVSARICGCVIGGNMLKYSLCREQMPSV
jgi:hypothetical protein